MATFLAGQGKDRELNTVLGSLAEAGLLADPDAFATADTAEIAAAWTHTNKPPSVRTLATLPAHRGLDCPARGLRGPGIDPD